MRSSLYKPKGDWMSISQIRIRIFTQKNLRRNKKGSSMRIRGFRLARAKEFGRNFIRLLTVLM